MLVIRPVAQQDLDQVLELTKFTGFGLSTLPQDREFLLQRIRESERSFQQMDDQRPRGECYLFVMEDIGAGRIAGTCAVVSKVGGFEPFYAYRIEEVTHQSEMLKVEKRMSLLHLVMEHNGPCEIGSLFLSPDYRREGNGRFLSLSRFLFMAEHPSCFDPMVIAEMRGVVDEWGHSPFWDAVGRHFFEIDYPKADYLSMVNKKFIADLMPRHPIYTALLPEPSRRVVAEVHPQTVPALRILESEGFSFSGMVDIFEGGPIVQCPLNRIRTVRQSRSAMVNRISDVPLLSETMMIMAVDPVCRATRGGIDEAGDGVVIERAVADALGLSVGGKVRYGALRPTTPAEELEQFDDAVALHPQPLD